LLQIKVYKSRIILYLPDLFNYAIFAISKGNHMGKDSLIKSTAGKSASKKKKSTAKKAASSKKASAKTKTNAASEIKPKDPTKPNTTKPDTKVTMKDLIFKQFDSQKPPTADIPASPDFSRMTAPPLIGSDDPQEVSRLRELLTRQYTMADIRAAAKEPEEIKAPADPEPVAEEPLAEPLPETPIAPEAQSTPPVSEPAAAQPTIISEADVAPSVSTVTTEAAAEPAPETSAPTPDASAPKVAAGAPSAGQTEAAQSGPSASEPPETKPGSSSPPPSGPNGGSEDPVMRAMKFGALALGLIAILIIWASYANSSRYYIQEERDGVTILRGMFSPTGTRTLVQLPKVTIDAPIQDVYTRKEVYPLVFAYYIANADGLLEKRGLPDFEAIQAYLVAAERFALNRDMRAQVSNRAENLQRMQLIHLAHVEISKGTEQALDAALQNLNQAKRLTSEPMQLEAIHQIENLVNERKAQLTPGAKPKPATEPTPATEPKPATEPPPATEPKPATEKAQER
jgi:hypothetical protein